jgi:hypothetical protein
MKGREAALDLLRRRGAANVPHPGGTLLEHLQRVADRLARHGGEEDLCLAGLTHAAYSTDGFDVRMLTLSERALLASVIGEDAEGLVYAYAACDRKLSWERLAVDRVIHDRWTGELLRPSPQALGEFTDLTVVNELDVVEHAPQIRAGFAGELLRLCRAWAGLCSSGVLADAEEVLASG